MDFDYTQVYTAFNAEDVKVGDIVFIGTTAADIYQKVVDAITRLACIVTAIQAKTLPNRFTVKTDTGFIIDVPYVYMLHSKGSEFYDFAKAIFEGKSVWCHVDGKVTEQKSIVFDHPASCYTLGTSSLGTSSLRMKEQHNGLYTFNYKGFDCELADCSGTDKYACFVNYYWDDKSGSPDPSDSDLLYWSFGSNCDLGNNYVVPKFILKQLDNWIKNNPYKKAQEATNE